MKNIDALSVASADMLSNDNALHKLYYYYFLMRVLEEAQNINVQDRFAIKESLRNITGVEFSNDLLLVAYVCKPVLSIDDQKRMYYKKCISESMWYIDLQIRVVENFMYIFRCILKLLSLYAFRADKGFDDMRQRVISEVYGLLSHIDVKHMSEPLIVRMYGEVEILISTFVTNDKRSYVDSLYMTSGVDFRQLDLNVVMEGIYD